MTKGVKNSSASTRGSFTLGRTRFAKISAVEGIDLTGSVLDELRDYDRQRLPPAKRRQAVVAKLSVAKRGKQ